MQEENKQGIQEHVDKQRDGKHSQPELIKRTSAPSNSQSLKKEPLDNKVRDMSKKIEK